MASTGSSPAIAATVVRSRRPPGSCSASPASSSATSRLGAGLIRLQLREHARGATIPSVRSLQVAFARAGVHRPRRRRAAAAVVPQAALPHEVWQVDAVENVPLATRQRSPG